MSRSEPKLIGAYRTQTVEVGYKAYEAAADTVCVLCACMVILPLDETYSTRKDAAAYASREIKSHAAASSRMGYGLYCIECDR